MAIRFLNVVLLTVLFGLAGAHIGINYGRLGDNLPPPATVVSMLKKHGIEMVKIFDANSTVLSAFANSNIQLWIAVENMYLTQISRSLLAANRWVFENVVAHYPATNVTTVIVGNEVLQRNRNGTLWRALVPAMYNIGISLAFHNLTHIKVTTAVSGDALNHSYPPSVGQFRDDIAEPIMRPLLQFLSNTKSFLTINPYPYFAYAREPHAVNLDYALLTSPHVVVQDGSYAYTNLLDSMVDARYAAMEKLGFQNVSLAIGETGWPTKGDIGASRFNASVFVQSLINKTLNKSTSGTPRRPNATTPTFIFALFQEDLKKSVRERHWGLLKPDGNRVYGFKFAITNISEIVNKHM